MRRLIKEQLAQPPRDYDLEEELAAALAARGVTGATVDQLRCSTATQRVVAKRVRKSNSKVDIPFTYVSTLVTHELEKQRPAPAPAPRRRPRRGRARRRRRRRAGAGARGRLARPARPSEEAAELERALAVRAPRPRPRPAGAAERRRRPRAERERQAAEAAEARRREEEAAAAAAPRRGEARLADDAELARALRPSRTRRPPETAGVAAWMPARPPPVRAAGAPSTRTSRLRAAVAAGPFAAAVAASPVSAAVAVGCGAACHAAVTAAPAPAPAPRGWGAVDSGCRRRSCRWRPSRRRRHHPHRGRRRCHLRRPRRPRHRRADVATGVAGRGAARRAAAAYAAARLGRRRREPATGLAAPTKPGAGARRRRRRRRPSGRAGAPSPRHPRNSERRETRANCALEALATAGSRSRSGAPLIVLTRKMPPEGFETRLDALPPLDQAAMHY